MSLRSFFTAVLMAVVPAMNAADTDAGEGLRPDSSARQLRPVEVVGLKQVVDVETSASTVVGADRLERLNILTVKGVSELAPNFYIPDYGSRMTSSIYVRGLGARIDQPVVGLSVDNVPVLNKDNYDFDLVDIERIEVLRGAQSTLNGRNTMAGQINIHTLSPWRFDGWRFTGEYGRANSLKLSAGWYGRISDELATSAVGYFTMTDGFFRNGYNGARLDTERQGSARWRLSWRPQGRVTVDNVAEVRLSRQGGYPYASLATGAIAYNDTCFYRRTSFSDGLTIGYRGPRVTVSSITSVQYIDDNMTLDQDFLPADYFTLTQKRREWALTEDLFTKGTRKCYSWLGGVFAFYKPTDMHAPVNFKDTGVRELIEKHRNDANPDYPITWDDRDFLLDSEFDMDAWGVALYHESTVSLGRFTAEAGLRWAIERTTLNYHSSCSSGFTTWRREPDGSLAKFSHTPVDIDDRGHLGRTFNELLPRLSLSWRFDFGTLYATWAKGYKAGGFNTQMFSDVLQQRVRRFMGMSEAYDIDQVVAYKPERSWDYEIGLKSSWLGGRLTADAAVFFIDCRDQQLTMFPDGTTTGRIMANAGRTFSRGAELSLKALPGGDVELSASYGFTRATFRKFDNGKADFAGKRVPYAPSHTAFAGVVWHMPFSLIGATPSAAVNVRGVGDIYWDEANTARQPFYALLGASLALTADRWSVRLWGENLTGTRYDTFYFLSMGNAFVQRGKPWTAGVTLRFNIGRD